MGFLVPSRAAETKEQQAEEVSEYVFTLSHVSSRNLLYPKSTAIRFPVPDEKVPWEVGILRAGSVILINAKWIKHISSVYLNYPLTKQIQILGCGSPIL